MIDPAVNNNERRSFFKYALFGVASLLATASSCEALLPGKDKEQHILSLSDGAEVLTDASRGSHFRLKTTQNFRLANPINAKDGQKIIWEIIQDGYGGHAIRLDDKFIISADLPKVALTKTPNKSDYMAGIYNALTDKWHVVAFIRGY